MADTIAHSAAQIINNSITEADYKLTAHHILTLDAAAGHSHDGINGGKKVAIADTLGTLAVGRGGTNLITVASGALLYASALDVIAGLVIGSNGQFLKVVTGLPAWATIAEADVTNLVTDLANKAPLSHTHPTTDIISGRFTLARIPDATTGQFIKSQGVGVDAIYAALVKADLPSVIAYEDEANLFTLLNRFKDVGLDDQDATPVADRRLRTIDGLIKSTDTTQVEGRFISKLSLELIADAEVAAAANIAKTKISTTGTWAVADIPDLPASKITSGVFAEARGGTNQSTYTAGDLLYASALNTLSKLAVGVVATYLRSTGSLPAWSAILDADLPATLSANARVIVRKNTGANVGTRRRLNLIEGTNITLTIADDAVDEEVDITIAAAGGGGNHNILSTIHPDTLVATVVRGDLMVGNLTPVWARLALGTSGQVLRSNGTDALWATLVRADISDFAHKVTHVSGGVDAFAKGDDLLAAARYLEDVADMVSDAQRLWLEDATANVKYWSDEVTPVKHTLERQANKGVASGYCDLDASILVPLSRLSGIVDAQIGTHTNTKITITAKGQLNSAIVYNDQNNIFGAFYQDIAQIAAPANPAVGTRRLFVDSADGKLKVRTSAGTSVSLEETGGAGTQTIRIPLALINPQVDANIGNSFFNVADYVTRKSMGAVEFVKDVDGKFYGRIYVPNNLGASPDAKIILSIMADATTGVTRLSVGWRNVADAGSFDGAFTAIAAQDITVPATAKVRKDVTFTLASQPAANNIIEVEIVHEGAHANDTLAINTILVDIVLECVVNT